MIIPVNATPNQAKHALKHIRHKQLAALVVVSLPGSFKLPEILRMRTLTSLNLLDSVSVRLDDFVALIKSMHLVSHLSVTADFHLFDLTKRMHTDIVFNESMNRHDKGFNPF